MNETRFTVKSEEGEDITLTAPQSIIEYAVYYFQCEDDGIAPISYDEWKLIQ